MALSSRCCGVRTIARKAKRSTEPLAPDNLIGRNPLASVARAMADASQPRNDRSGSSHVRPPKSWTESSRCSIRDGSRAKGPIGAELESEFAARIGVRHAIAVLQLHCGAAPVSACPGSPARATRSWWRDYTFPATGHSVLYVGAKPVFVDVLAETWTIDPAQIERAIGPRTRGIIAVGRVRAVCGIRPSLPRSRRAMVCS